MSDIMDISNKLATSLRSLRATLADADALAPLVEEVPRYDGDEADLDSFPLRLAFVGQYSAGKSTLINALTGVDLPVGAGIVTDCVAEVPWDGVWLVDTPGVQTGTRDEHDARSQAAYRAADLIIFVTTTQLLDTAGHALLQELAGRQRKARQMAFVVNKASQDTASPGSLLAAAREAIQPHDLPTVLCDAKDYLDAEKEDDEELRAELRQDANLEELRNVLTSLASENGIFGRLASPAQAAAEVAEQGLAVCASEEAAATARCMDLETAQKAYQQAAEHLKESGNRIVMELRRNVAELADEPCALIEMDEQGDGSSEGGKLGQLLRDADEHVESHQDAAMGDLDSLLRSVQARLEAENQAVAEKGEVAQLLVDRPSVSFSAPSESKSKVWLEETTTDVFRQAADAVTSSLTFRLPIGTSPGDELHALVHNVKRTIHGSDIRPWSVVKSAKKIEGITTFLNKLEPGIKQGALKGIDLALDEAVRRWGERKRAERSSQLRKSFQAASEDVSAEMQKVIDDLVTPFEQKIGALTEGIAQERNRADDASSREGELEALHSLFREIEQSAESA